MLFAAQQHRFGLHSSWPSLQRLLVSWTSVIRAEPTTDALERKLHEEDKYVHKRVMQHLIGCLVQLQCICVFRLPMRKQNAQ